MNNAIVTTLSWLAVVAHIAVGIVAWRRGSAIPLLPLINIAAALCVGGYWLKRLIAALIKGLIWYPSDQVWSVYALVVCAFSGLALTGRVAWNGLHWTVFTAHLLVCIAAALFFTFFKMNRMF